MIDEIDKADTSVPNGLLEYLGQGTFSVPGFDEAVHARGPAPLVVLTTNEDRALPDAFVRRCVVLHLRVPDHEQWADLEPGSLAKWLCERGRAHFADLDEGVLQAAAEQLVDDRRALRAGGHCLPGLAEYIDLVAAVKQGRAAGDETSMEDIAQFVLRKHAEPWERADSRWRGHDE